MKDSNDVKKAVEDSISSLSKVFAEFPWKDKMAYANWLAQTYYFVRHTTTFLALVAAYYGPGKRESQYHTLKHLKEEMNHDILALQDLKALGFELSQFPEMPETAAFYQSQYYYIQFLGPATLLGYSMCLEGIAANEAAGVAKILNEAYAGKASRFMKSHAVADQEHIVEGFESLENLGPEEVAAVISNAKQSEHLYKTMIEGILRTSAGKKNLKIAA